MVPGHSRTPALIARNHRLLSHAAEARLQTKAVIAQSEVAVSQATNSIIAVVAKQRAVRANLASAPFPQPFRPAQSAVTSLPIWSC
jgi:hypothetical protein